MYTAVWPWDEAVIYSAMLSTGIPLKSDLFAKYIEFKVKFQNMLRKNRIKIQLSPERWVWFFKSFVSHTVKSSEYSLAQLRQSSAQKSDTASATKTTTTTASQSSSTTSTTSATATVASAATATTTSTASVEGQAVNVTSSGAATSVGKSSGDATKGKIFVTKYSVAVYMYFANPTENVTCAYA